MFAWHLVNNTGYAEVVVGYTFAPNPGWEGGVGVGLETDPDPSRIYGHLWHGGEAWGKPYSALAIAETGGSGFWYLGEAFVSAWDWLSYGVRSQRFVGTGALVRLHPSERFTLWSVPRSGDFETGGWHSVIGLRINFK